MLLLTSSHVLADDPISFGVYQNSPLVVMDESGHAQGLVIDILDAHLQAPAALIGTLMAVGQLLAAPVALTAPLLVDRWGTGRTVFRGRLGAAMVIAAIGWSQMLGNEEIKLRLNDGYSA